LRRYTVSPILGDMDTTLSRTAELNFLGARVRILAGEGGLGLIDMLEIPAGDMPPLHLHRREDEGFYVVDGRMTLYLPGRTIELAPGEFALAPRGVPHTYRVGDEPAHVLVTSTPSGFERFVGAVAALPEVDPAALTAVAADHDIEILGPPGMLP
jgi:quercetin dioxygenase-like cupin family protein